MLELASNVFPASLLLSQLCWYWSYQYDNVTHPIGLVTLKFSFESVGEAEARLAALSSVCLRTIGSSLKNWVVISYLTNSWRPVWVGSGEERLGRLVETSSDYFLKACFSDADPGTQSKSPVETKLHHFSCLLGFNVNISNCRCLEIHPEFCE